MSHLSRGTTNYPEAEGRNEGSPPRRYDHVMRDNVEDPDGEGLIRFYSNACYSCEEEGHYYQYCTKESKEYLGDFSTAEVKFDPQEIEALVIRKKSKKRKRRHHQNNPISTEKDPSNITCYRCKDLGHYTNKCP